MFLEKEGKLIYSYDGETVCIEAWGKDALRLSLIHISEPTRRS